MGKIGRMEGVVGSGRAWRKPRQEIPGLRVPYATGTILAAAWPEPMEKDGKLEFYSFPIFSGVAIPGTAARSSQLDYPNENLDVPDLRLDIR